MDVPVLKSGKETRYRELPASTIIFITQEDIFHRDLAKYTFIEQCEEVQGLHLEDGTTKIFLNMESKNGSQELISLLQYMKRTTLNNPDILIKGKNLLELDRIVTEVKESEEWEAVQMTLLEIGVEQGRAEGKEQGRAEGKKEAILELLEDYDRVPAGIQEMILAEQNPELLKKWHKLAAKSGSIEEFLTGIS